MRIAHFLAGRCNPDTANGVEKTVYYLSRSQAALGESVALFSISNKEPISIPGVRLKTYSLKNFYIFSIRKLLEDLIAWRPDVLHLHSVFTPVNWQLAQWAKSQQLDYVITPNGGLSPLILKRRWYIKNPYRRLFELPMLNQAMFVHSVGDTKNIKSFGVRVPIVTVPNGVELKAIPLKRSKEAIVAKFPALSGKRVFLFLGRLDIQQKGLDLLLEGFSRAMLSGAMLLIAGPDRDGQRKVLNRLAQKFNISSQVIFANAVFGKEKFDFLSGADVFVHTSRWEGMPFSVLEAAEIGLPCLITPAANLNGWLTKFGGGFEASTEVKSLIAAFNKIATLSDSELQVMGANNRELIKAKFQWSEIAGKLNKAYLSYLTPKNAKRIKFETQRAILHSAS